MVMIQRATWASMEEKHLTICTFRWFKMLGFQSQFSMWSQTFEYTKFDIFHCFSSLNLTQTKCGSNQTPCREWWVSTGWSLRVMSAPFSTLSMPVTLTWTVQRLLWPLTLQCRTTTCWGSEFSQFSMALHMAQILSSGGACMSGQPKSWTWGSERDFLSWLVLSGL